MSDEELAPACRGSGLVAVKVLTSTIIHMIGGKSVTNFRGERCGMERETAERLVRQGAVSFDLNALTSEAEVKPAATRSKVTLRILRSFKCYIPGDVVGFEADDADRLIGFGVAETAERPKRTVRTLDAIFKMMRARA